jgi:nucleoside-diphosphate-sugar epimerase
MSLRLKTENNVALCLVTGGAGFIGSHLVEALLTRGNSVRVLDNLSSGYIENLQPVINHIEFFNGDIQDSAIVKKAMHGVDYVFHLAAMVSVPQSMHQPMDAELMNAAGTLNLLQAASEAGVRCFVLSSTCAVYGDEPTLPKIETMLPEPKSPYAVAKLAGEHYCQVFNESFNLKTVIFRYFNVFGPRQDPSSAYSGVISIFADKLSQGVAPTIFGDGEQTRDFVYVADVVQANLLAVETEQAAGQVFNIGTGQQSSINQLFKTLCGVLGCDIQPNYASPRVGDIVHSFSNPDRAKTVLGWQAEVGLEEGLRNLVADLKISR